LAKLGGDGVSGALTALMLGDPSGSVRWEAAKALVALAPAQTIPELLEALSADSSVHVRAAAADALGQIGSNHALDGLIEALLHDKSDHVRLAAARALGKINDSEAIPALVQALNTDSSPLWHAAAEALWEMDIPAMPFVLQALLDTDARQRRAALKAVLWLSVEHDEDSLVDRDDIYWADFGTWLN
jgi:HEAT repeat protein